jgi:O-antigen/teichoic acid export membrane protein
MSASICTRWANIKCGLVKLTMPLLRSVGWNWFSQLYIAFAGILIIPVYIRHFGAEAYGLIAFMLTLQSLMTLLDIGFSASLSRETSRFRAGVSDANFFYSLIRIIQRIFLLTGVVIAGAIFFSAPQLSSGWLDVQQLDIEYVTYLLQISAVIILLRWLAVFFRSVIFGYEDIIWLAKFTTLIATLRFLAVLPLIAYWQIDVEFYFYYQLVVQAVEIVVLFLRKRKLLPRLRAVTWLSIYDPAFKAPVRFTLAAGGATVLWLLISQADKVFASKFLTLADYGYFHVAVMAAGMITIITAPIIQALQPRVTSIVAGNDLESAIVMLKQLFDFMIVVAAVTVLVVYVFGFRLLSAWYGEDSFAHRTFDVFFIYSAANAILAINSCSYILDYATGRIRLRNFFSIIMLLILVVAFPISFYLFSSIGAAVVWLTINVLYLLLCQPMLLSQYSAKIFPAIFKHSLLPRFGVFSIVIVVSYLAELPQLTLALDNRLAVFLVAAFSWALLLLGFMLTQSASRAFLMNKLSGLYERT